MLLGKMVLRLTRKGRLTKGGIRGLIVLNGRVLHFILAHEFFSSLKDITGKASENWKVLKELEKAAKKVNIDINIEGDLASAQKVKECPHYIGKEVRTADELVQMISHFYYNANKPSCINDDLMIFALLSQRGRVQFGWKVCSNSVGTWQTLKIIFFFLVLKIILCFLIIPCKNSEMSRTPNGLLLSLFPEMKKQSQSLFLLPFLLCFQSISGIDFIFNGFESSNLSLYGHSTIESRVLTLTNDSTFSIGRALYPSKIVTKQGNSSKVLPFSTSFIFAIAPYKGLLPGHGMVFLFVPHTGIDGAASAQYLGLFNSTNDGSPDNHVFGVEFDVLQNEDINDMNNNHVGIDVNSVKSEFDHEAGYWSDDSRPLQNLVLNSGSNYQVWIDYADSEIKVTMAPAGMKRPKVALLYATLNLSQVFEDEMYVGFTAATGQLVESHKILAWSFSNSNFSLSEALINTNLPSFVLPKDPSHRSKGFIAGITLGLFMVLVLASLVSVILFKRNRRRRRRRRRRREREEMEDWELEYWPHSTSAELPVFDLRTIVSATDNFSFANKLGQGGFGSVYKGRLHDGQEVAVKRLSKSSGQGVKEFKNEVTLIARLQHRNLVRLYGCCIQHEEKMLIYEYLPNKGLDNFIFDKAKRSLIYWRKCFEIIMGVARGMVYLHRDSRLRIIHRDLKASNVLLDAAMEPKISDFGMARIFGANQMEANTNRVVGTYGYMSPEYAMGGLFSDKTDVFSFGVLLMEIISGKKNNSYYDTDSVNLIGHAWNLWREGNSLDIVDPSLVDSYQANEVSRCILIGLLCVQEHASDRPTMAEVLSMLSNETTLSAVSPNQPAFVIRRGNSYQNPSPASLGAASVNDVTVSAVQAR
ncbi:hypothetical protein M9H77_25696 [Catharanthus roseus]|uniref:Uncharacterized protein n=1 Tax=Catharanthus roseus TaxID=4058 RepID=A0ACC0ABV2_CATRO|nr:hypothetical protein M9H77_25696 [Catharanthus roseus]